MKIKAQLVKMAFTVLLALAILSCSFVPLLTVNAAANVTVTLYVYMYGSDPKITPALPGVLVTGKDGNGAYFSQTTNASGYVSITGATGVWTFTVSDWGYQTNGPRATSIDSSTTLQSFLIPSAQTTSAFLN